ncbi:MAG: hypothetical protein CO189_03435, partial [candidate division Zixibacteria bacterium CG_4_9_14_3_um_filter_46_8]
MFVRKISLILLLIIVYGLVGITTIGAQNLQVHVIDVGQGHSTLIISPTGQTMLIDAGELNQVLNVKSYLASLGISHINYFVATHYHSDHIGSVANGLLNQGITFGTVYDRGWEYCTWIYDDYLLEISSIRQTINDGQVID